MFDRKKIKRFSNIQLKNRWAVPVIMTLITGVVFYFFKIPSFVDIWKNRLPDIVTSGNGSIWEVVINYEPPISSNLLDIISYLCFFIFNVAQIHVYLIMSRGPESVQLTEFFNGFNLWIKAVLAGLWSTLWIALWSFLFIIPGIVKSISYSQMFYIVAEYPKVSVSKAMRISIAITRGYKGDLFMLALSYIGWVFVSLISFGIGFLWLLPYVNMTAVNAYHWLMKQALESKVITPEDLGVSPEQLYQN